MRGIISYLEKSGINYFSYHGLRHERLLANVFACVSLSSMFALIVAISFAPNRDIVETYIMCQNRNAKN